MRREQSGRFVRLLIILFLILSFVGTAMAEECSLHIGEVKDVNTVTLEKPASAGVSSKDYFSLRPYIKKVEEEFRCRMELTGLAGGTAKAYLLDAAKKPVFTVVVTVMGHETQILNARAATCTEPGYTGDVCCNTCGLTIPGREIAATGHKEVIDQPAVEPTCTANGHEAVSHCSVCGATIGTGEILPATGHSWIYQQLLLLPTCTEPGLAEYLCTKCRMIQRNEIPPLGHTEVSDPGRPATRTESGLTDGSHCSVCGAVIKAQEIIPPIDPTQEFVSRCYHLILNRGADGPGLAEWTETLKNQTAAASQIISGFMRSPEFTARGLNGEQRVSILYQTMLGRGADPDGSSGWTAVLDNGCTDDRVINGFCGSVEFNSICADYGIRAGEVTLSENRDINPKVTAFVSRCYKETLGRGGDPEGLNAWCGAILNKEATPQKVAKGFTSSPEMQMKEQTDEEFIRTMYSLYLGRECDPAGLNDWMAALDTGATREQVEEGFAASPEFSQIVEGYGI